MLEAAGLVHHVHPGAGPRVYSLAKREYAFCEECHELRPLTDAEAKAIRTVVTGFEASFAHHPLTGRCDRCSAQMRPVRNEF